MSRQLAPRCKPPSILGTRRGCYPHFMGYWGTGNLENGYGVDAEIETKAFIVRKINGYLAAGAKSEMDEIVVDTVMGFVELLRIILVESGSPPSNMRESTLSEWRTAILSAVDAYSVATPERAEFVAGRRVAIEATFAALVAHEAEWAKTGLWPMPGGDDDDDDSDDDDVDSDE